MAILKKGKKKLDGQLVDTIEEAVLYTDNDCFYPVIKGIPRLTVEAIVDYEFFLKTAITDYEQRKERVLLKYGDLIAFAQKKNKRTKESFTQEWAIFDYEKDKTWDADDAGMLDRFLRETDESIDSLKNKIVFDEDELSGFSVVAEVCAVDVLLLSQAAKTRVKQASESIFNLYIFYFLIPIISQKLNLRIIRKLSTLPAEVYLVHPCCLTSLLLLSVTK